MRVLPITGSWLYSRRAQQVYFVCACTVFGAVIFGLAFIAADSILEGDTLQNSALVEEMTRTVILATIIACSILTVGMWYHALRSGGLEDNPLWMLMLFLLAIVPGAMLYYVLRYRRAVKRAIPVETGSAAGAGR